MNRPVMSSRRGRGRERNTSSLLSSVSGVMGRVDWSKLFTRVRGSNGKMKRATSSITERASQFLKDLYDQERKRRAHLLLLAGRLRESFAQRPPRTAKPKVYSTRPRTSRVIPSLINDTLKFTSNPGRNSENFRYVSNWLW